VQNRPSGKELSFTPIYALGFVAKGSFSRLSIV